MRRVNRAAVAVLAVVLMVGGGAGLGMGLGLFGSRHRHTRLLPPWVSRDWLDLPGAARAAILIAIGIVAVLVGAILVGAALRVSRIHRDDVGELLVHAPPTDRGRTRVHANVFARAVEADLARSPAIARARIGLTTRDGSLVVNGLLEVTGSPQRAQRAMSAALERLATTSGRPCELEEMEVKLVSPASR